MLQSRRGPSMRNTTLALVMSMATISYATAQIPPELVLDRGYLPRVQQSGGPSLAIPWREMQQLYQPTPTAPVMPGVPYFADPRLSLVAPRPVNQQDQLGEIIR